MVQPEQHGLEQVPVRKQIPGQGSHSGVLVLGTLTGGCISLWFSAFCPMAGRGCPCAEQDSELVRGNKENHPCGIPLPGDGPGLCCQGELQSIT